ncbi:uncharacterized protein LOC111900456 [Lactuca sativa]|uniref:uncharacterized protein LOC111900456 n=1 Tax=Lactuca sativa TaxID=4236 RepID=UPI000CD81F51|nr:uncharacterized protein LOC111900456 [Lactuca sativa]
MKTIHSFFKRKVDNEEIHDKNEEIKRHKASTSEPQPQEHENQQENDRNEATQSNPNEVVQADLKQLERDSAKRKQIWEYPVNLREEVRRAYMSLGPFQIHLKEYHAKGSKKHPRRFQYSWFNIFPNWLEYSPTTHASYCFICFIFNDKPSVSHGYDAFTVKGFDNWKKVNDGKNCAFLKHIGCSQHRNAVAFTENLMNQEAHIENIIMKQNEEQILKNRLRLKASIVTVRWLTFQACALRGHDESPNSKNRGNFLQLLKLLASYNDEVANVILEKAPYNSKYTSGEIQKEILSIIANKVRKHIRSEVGDSYFCVMVDESKKEQMAIVLRFVDVEGIIRERFLDLVHVTDTLSLNLKTNMWRQLLHYQFDVSKIRGQGYDGASNMRGEWNGLQALVLKDCPYAYYVHCFAHRLQLALVAASREIIPVHQFFTNLIFLINVVCASSKRHDELQKAKATEIEQLLELGEIESGKGLNQVGTLKRAGDTRWGSHFRSVCSLLNMFDCTRVVLQGIIDDVSATYSQRGDADAAYCFLKSFDFVFILHSIKEIMGKTDVLSQALQKKSQDILNVMELVSATKESLNEFRNKGWDSLLAQVKFFCEKHQIDMPDMNAPYTSTRYRPRKTDHHVTFEHFYRVDLFTITLDKQLHELNSRFNDQAMELLSLSSTLVSKEHPKVIKVDQICRLVEKYYPEDFTEQERIQLRYQLEIFNIDMTKNPKLSGVSTIADSCKGLVETQKRETYYLLDRVVRLILTLPVSTATTERGFSAMKIFKNRLRNTMTDDFLANNLVVYIEREIAENIDSKSVIDEFKDLKGRRAEL